MGWWFYSYRYWWITMLCALVVTGAAQTVTPGSSAPCYNKTSLGGGSTCADRYAIIPGSVNCLNHTHSFNPDTVKVDNKKIEEIHNAIRVSVQPPSGNMIKLVYQVPLERTAKFWANTCMFKKQDTYSRFEPGKYSVGQNIFTSTSNKTWSEVIHSWASENATFVYNSTKNSLNQSGNYVQLVWAETTGVGCAMSNCNGTFFYVCNYAPGMDENDLSRPYQYCAYNDTSCDVCPNAHNTSGLCDCYGVVCLNGAKVDWDNCECKCISSVKNYTGKFCGLRCHNGSDYEFCNRHPYENTSCKTNLDTLYHCPWMCGLCPYAGDDYVQGSEPLPWQKGMLACPTTTSTTSTTERRLLTITSNSKTYKTSDLVSLSEVVSTENTNHSPLSPDNGMHSSVGDPTSVPLKNISAVQVELSLVLLLLFLLNPINNVLSLL